MLDGEMIDEASRAMAAVVAAKGRAAGLVPITPTIPHIYALPFRAAARMSAARPDFATWRPRASTSASASTFSVITLPAARNSSATPTALHLNFCARAIRLRSQPSLYLPQLGLESRRSNDTAFDDTDNREGTIDCRQDLIVLIKWRIRDVHYVPDVHPELLCDKNRHRLLQVQPKNPGSRRGIVQKIAHPEHKNTGLVGTLVGQSPHLPQGFQQRQVGLDHLDVTGLHHRAKHGVDLGIRAYDDLIALLDADIAPVEEVRILGSQDHFAAPTEDAIVVGEESGSLSTELRRCAALQSERAFGRLNALAEWLPRLIYIAVLGYVGWSIVRVYRDYLRQVMSLIEGL